MSDAKPPLAGAAGSAPVERLKATFIVNRPLRNPSGLRDMRQSAKDWIAILMESLGDSLAEGGDGTITMIIGGLEIEFAITNIPGRMVTKRVRIAPPNEGGSHGS